MKRTAKGASLKVATANALTSGAVVFLTADGHWSRDIAEASIAPDAEAAERLLAAANADVERDIVVEAYLINVQVEETRVVPDLLRESIRARGGPTIHENRTPPDPVVAA